MRVKSLHLVISLLILGTIVIVSRLPIIQKIEFPGHADRSYYYTVAYNLYHGKGLHIDYIWEFLSGRTRVSDASNLEYWMPASSVMMFLAMQAWGDDSAKIASYSTVAFAAILAALSYVYSYILYTKSHLLGWAVGLVVAFSPHVFNNSVVLDSPIFYAVFALLAFFLLELGQRGNRNIFIFLTGTSIGLAHLSRSDGLLLFVAIFMYLLLGLPKKETIFRLATMSIGYGLILGVWLVRNLVVLGRLQPGGTMSHFAFSTGREDGLYSYNADVSLDTYLAQGFTVIFEQKQDTILWIINHVLMNLLGYVTPLLVFFVLLQLFQWRGSLKERWTILRENPFTGVFLFGLFLFVAYGLMFASVGKASFSRSGVALVPFVAIAGIHGLTAIIPSRVSILSIIVFLLLISYPATREEARLIVKEQNIIGRTELANADYIHHGMALHPPKGDPVVMTATPWQFHVASGMKAVNIPFASAETVVEVARKYNVDYMVLPRDIMFQERPLLQDLYEEKAWPEGVYVLAQDDRSDRWKVFKFVLEE
ncbi:MAG: hypothetical protein AAF629_17335 [Chloroflexota bacterium]